MRDHVARRLKEEHGRVREPKAHEPPASRRAGRRPTAVPPRRAGTVQRRAPRGARGLHGAPEARHAARAPAQPLDAGTIDWARPRRSPSRRCSRDGIHVRMTGQDTERGTFSNRHAVLHDVETGELFTPMST